MIEALQTATSGIRSGFAQLERSADSIAHRLPRDRGASTVTTDTVHDSLSSDVIQSIIAKHTVTANAAMFRRVDSTVGELIDLRG